MRLFNFKIIHRKDTPEKIRADALNKIIDEKIKTTPELTARKDAVVLAKQEVEK